jgi:sugar lactone lactonase YvrE
MKADNGCSLSFGERVRVSGWHTQKVTCAFLFCALILSLHAQDSVTTLAGQVLVSGAANGTGTNAAFSDPAATVADANGNFFVADSQNNAIRKITTNGVVTTFAGQLGVAGSANGTGTGAQFTAPCGLAIDPAGNLYVSDTGNNFIRKITPGGAVSTYAGVAGAGGFLDGAAGGALFNSPLGIAVAPNGTIFVADSGNQCIREISGGVVSTFAGSPQVWGSADGQGTGAQFNGPVGLAFDSRTNLFVCDANNDTIRKIAPDGTVTTFAGAVGADGAADGDVGSARFSSPAELTFDRKGNLFVADSLNQTVREIFTNGMVSTVSGAAGDYGATDGMNGAGRFYNPYGLAMGADGTLFLTDTYNELVRTVLVPFRSTLQMSGNAPAATVSWDAVIGKNYQVQFKNNPAAAWANLGESVTATNLSMSATDNSGIGPQQFYRVLVTP